MPMEIEQRIETWKNKLMDLGKRNRLINYKENMSSTLTITAPGISELWNRVVEREAKIVFPNYREIIEEEDGEYSAVVEDISSSDIITNRNGKDTLRILRKLKNSAKTAAEEQGINILYLAYGFLDWTETNYSKEQFRSPLVLVPVNLTVDSIQDPFVMQKGDDEIVVNPALKYKMETELGVVFPQYEDGDNLFGYIEKVEQIAKKYNWKVVPEVGLSLFSFLKIDMYFDLEKNKEKIVATPIIRAIGGDASELEHIPEDLSTFDFDEKLKPKDVYQVVDADSSQQEAILCAKKGYSFVLQGPPGTGKSQTITNIIAECLADGKKVLFVSEKKAALDVVYKRLVSAGLDPFCLVVHGANSKKSKTASKKAVLEQLRVSMDLANNKYSVSNSVYAELESLYKDRLELNEYAKAVNERIEPLNMSIFQANGTLASLEEYENVSATIPEVRETSFERYLEYLRLLDRLKGLIKIDDSSVNAWHGANVTAVTNELRQNIRSRLPRLANDFKYCSEVADEAFKTVGVAPELSFQGIQDMTSLFEIAKDSPQVPLKWITDIDIDQCMEEVKTHKERRSNYLEKASELDGLYRIINETGEYDFELCKFVTPEYAEVVNEEKQRLKKLLEEDSRLSLIEKWSPERFREDQHVLEEELKEIVQYKKSVAQYFSDGVFRNDCRGVLEGYKKSYVDFVESIEKEYDIDPLLAQPFKLISKEWMQTDLALIISEAQECEENQRLLKSLIDEMILLEKQLTQDNVFLQCNTEDLKSSESLNAVKVRIENYISSHSVWSSLEKGSNFALCKKDVEVAKEKVKEIVKIKNEVLQDFDREFFMVDYEGLLRRYKLDYGSKLKRLKSSYREDSRQMKLLYKNTSIPLDNEMIISSLSKLKGIQQIREDIDSKCPALVEIYSETFRYEETDFAMIEKELDLYEVLEHALELVRRISELVNEFESKDSERAQWYESLYDGHDTSWDLVLKVLQWTDSFKKQIAEEKEVFLPFCKTPEDLSEKRVLAVLNKLEIIRRKKEHCKNCCSHVISVLGSDFDYENTDFKKLDSLIIAHGKIKQSIEILDQMQELIKQYLEKGQFWGNRYGHFYNGILTDWNEVETALEWTLLFKQAIEKYRPSKDFVSRVCSDHEMNKLCGSYHEKLTACLKCIEPNLNWFLGLFDKTELNCKSECFELTNRMTDCVKELSLLEQWIDYRKIRKACAEIGLDEFVEEVLAQHIDPDHIVPVFKKLFFHLWLDAVEVEYPAVQNFRSAVQERKRQEFATFDRDQFEIAKARIRSSLLNGYPTMDGFTNGTSEVGILKRELGKKKRIMPIRKLFKEIPNLLLKLKPCLMMSPLTVSRFLEADTYQFDVVIFDEASQVCTENAIGAILRGKQVVIAGDSKQLPPTSFFASTGSDADEYDSDDEDDSIAFESILDEAALLPEKTLLWHYRSRHEHLIAFSNVKFYRNNLITFPSSIDESPNVGVQYVYVEDGVYDRGGRKGNVSEAKRVAQMVFEHFEQFPKRSLGVVAFGEVQQQAIEMQIRAMRLENPEYEAFFDEEAEEAFFVKNLENVQGDERDTIIFSIGYAKDVHGVFRMQFGPLSQPGGERRLNVAITRAKYNVKLVGSILPTDINLDRISSEGPKMLRSYIDFAMHGISALQNEITASNDVQHDSPFEEAVYKYLEDHSYKLATQVGCSGYRIDMAVKDPNDSGRYVLGIECDGASYHSARTARERDRLRQDVLENMGWKIYRIWSTDWVKDPLNEGKRLIAAVDAAIQEEEVRKLVDNQVLSVKAEELVTCEEKVVTEEDISNPYGFIREKEVLLEESGVITVEDVFAIIVAKFPINQDRICRECAPILGLTKVTSRVRKAVENCMWRLEYGGRIKCENGFYYPCGDVVVLPRVNTRKIEDVSIEELAEAMYVVLSNCGGATKEELCRATANAYNYQRLSDRIWEALDEACILLIKTGRIEIDDGKAVILD